MKVSVYGKSPHINTKLLRKASRFYIRQLIPDIYDKIEVKISILQKLIKDDVECWGYCTPKNIKQKNPKIFHIYLHQDMNKHMMLKTLAHEMVHVKQYAKNTLTKDNAGRYKWKGEVVTAYWSAYYEKEAYRRENKLYKAFKKFYSNPKD